jgi:hypothetical protein
MRNLTVVETKPEPITRENYDRMALAFATKAGAENYPIIVLDSPECVAWERYFNRQLGGLPWTFTRLKSGETKHMTVPTQWPEWFDGSYAS